VGWAEALLRLAVEANDARDGVAQAGSDMLPERTLKLVLTKAVQTHRAGQHERPAARRAPRPGWNPSRPSDECGWSDLSEMSCGILGHDPPALHELP